MKSSAASSRSRSHSHTRSHSHGGRGRKRWVAGVKTDSTHPPPGLFKRSASQIARTLASRKVSPKGPGSGMRMLNYYINRGGHNLSAARRRELEKAKALLSAKIARTKPRTRSARKKS